ncbi:MAG TPA: hypothetical protein PLD25_29715 [Chloroflexota bacterium]|nr:hypothetical protein [Chloroflexota bacterium]HUM67308.1 hypothetical protein [Chloroflexota bacterium]
MNESHTDPLQRSARLKQEADFVLQAINLYEIVQPYGRITPTGSYYLDVMAYPDIDLYLSKISVAELFAIGGWLAASDLVFQVVFEKSQTARLPGGLYLKPRIAYGDWRRPWKIDIWSLDDEVIDQQMAEIHRFQQAMTAEIREQIIHYKHTILTESRRTPMYSGYHICKAFIDEGLTDFQAVTAYLVEQGVRMG